MNRLCGVQAHKRIAARAETLGFALCNAGGSAAVARAVSGASAHAFFSGFRLRAVKPCRHAFM